MIEAQKVQTVVFLGDSERLSRLVLMRRGDDRPFAPGLYTGIGGKAEPGESPRQAASRELEEETGLTGLRLREFGRLVVNDGCLVLCYFFGLMPAADLPQSDEGSLEWSALDQVLRHDFIPTTRVFVELWQQRGWSRQPFTVRVERQPFDDLRAEISVLTVREGLER